MLQRAGASDTIFTEDAVGRLSDLPALPREYRFLSTAEVIFTARTFNEKYLDVMNVRYDWEKNLDQYHVNTILLPPTASLAGTLKESRRWRPVYDDGVAIVFRAADAGSTEANQVSAVSRGGKDRDRKITKSQTT